MSIKAGPGVTYYIIREGRPPTTILSIHRVYDASVACFQKLMDCGVESIDMWGVTSNERGIVVTEWIIHSYTRDVAVLHQHAPAGIHREDNIAPMKVPAPPPTSS
jgi:hypothetical protein